MIKAEIIADSLSPQGDRLTTFVLTFPRFILAELNTHRMFSRNSASSRAIPFEKMVKAVEENPFIPIAWQRNHKGMQGTEYLEKEVKYNIIELSEFFMSELRNLYKNNSDIENDDSEVIDMWNRILDEFILYGEYTLEEFWLTIRNKVITSAILMRCLGVTKQLCNRLLEPFMWHTVILTSGSEGLQNFFELRCPDYKPTSDLSYKSKKDCWNAMGPQWDLSRPETDLDWLKMNKGQSEIHMMTLAEAMWDVYNESKPKKLKEGEWHIPFGDSIEESKILKDLLGLESKEKKIEEKIVEMAVGIATARCARVSYTVVGEENKEPNYENDIKLHNKLLESGHMSPFEHCARAMTTEEYLSFHKGLMLQEDFGDGVKYLNSNSTEGWCNNFRGFIQYRYLVENEEN